MINFIVEVDEAKEPKELIEMLRKNHGTFVYCKDCLYYNEDKTDCPIFSRSVLEYDFCSWGSKRFDLKMK